LLCETARSRHHPSLTHGEGAARPRAWLILSYDGELTLPPCQAESLFPAHELQWRSQAREEETSFLPMTLC